MSSVSDLPRIRKKAKRVFQGPLTPPTKSSFPACGYPCSPPIRGDLGTLLSTEGDWNVRETLSTTASTNGLICSDGCVDGEDDGCVDGCFDFDELAIFDSEVPVVANAKAAAPSKEEDVQKSAASSASAAGASEASACFSNPQKCVKYKQRTTCRE